MPSLQRECLRGECTTIFRVRYPSSTRLFCSQPCRYASRRSDPEARFWSKVNKDGPVIRPDLGPCWLWRGKTMTRGYGVFSVGYQTILAHRFAYRVQCGALDNDDDVCHRCDNPPCVRGSHLFRGDAVSNAADMVSKNRHSAATHPESVPRGEQQGQAKLIAAQVMEIKARLANGERPAQIAIDYPVGRTAIYLISIGRNWTHIQFPSCRKPGCEEPPALGEKDCSAHILVDCF